MNLSVCRAVLLRERTLPAFGEESQAYAGGRKLATSSGLEGGVVRDGQGGLESLGRAKKVAVREGHGLPPTCCLLHRWTRGHQEQEGWHDYLVEERGGQLARIPVTVYNSQWSFLRNLESGVSLGYSHRTDVRVQGYRSHIQYNIYQRPLLLGLWPRRPSYLYSIGSKSVNGRVKHANS